MPENFPEVSSLFLKTAIFKIWMSLQGRKSAAWQPLAWRGGKLQLVKRRRADSQPKISLEGYKVFLTTKK